MANHPLHTTIWCTVHSTGVLPRFLLTGGCGANAIIGADIDYGILAPNLIMVVANGTPVIIENLKELQSADWTAKR